MKKSNASNFEIGFMWVMGFLVVILFSTVLYLLPSSAEAATTDDIVWPETVEVEAIPLAREILASYSTKGVPKTKVIMEKLAKKAQQQAEVMIQYQRNMQSDEPDVY